MKNKYIKRINFDVHYKFHKALKIAAAQNNMSIKMYIVGLLVEEMKKTGFIKTK